MKGRGGEWRRVMKRGASDGGRGSNGGGQGGIGGGKGSSPEHIITHVPFIFICQLSLSFMGSGIHLWAFTFVHGQSCLLMGGHVCICLWVGMLLARCA